MSVLIRYGPYFLAAVIITALVQDIPFFWDTISQASRRSSWFYENQLRSILLPFELDSGHPTGFNLYLASCWTFFGRTLAVSHWAMLPILFGVIYQSLRLVDHFFTAKERNWAAILILTDVTLLAQCTLVSPDLVILLGYLMGLRGILHQKKPLMAIGAMLLVSVSIRGIFGLMALGLTALIVDWYRSPVVNWRLFLKALIPLVPAALLITGFYTWHFLQTGWWLITPNPDWAGHRDILSFKGILRNIGITGWRLLDFGRFSYWLIFGWFFFIWLRQKKTISSPLRFLLIWPVVFLLTLTAIMTMLSNPITHRYFLPALLGLNALGAYIIFKKLPLSWKKWAYSFVLLAQLSGHCWLYPKHIAQAWDASLAYLPYISLRTAAIDFAREQDIPLTDLGTEFPAIGPLDRHELNNDSLGFSDWKKPTPYLFYASVMNDFSDHDLQEMETWKVIWQKHYLGHQAIIYQRPE